MAFPGVDMSACRPARFVREQLLCAARLNRKALPMQVRVSYCGADRVQTTFVKIACSEAWLLKAVTGSASRSSLECMFRTTLLQDLHAAVAKASNGELVTVDPSSFDAAVAAEAVDEADPMDDIDGGDALATPQKKRKKNKRAKHQAHNNILVVSFPEVTRLVDPEGTDMRDVTLFVERKNSIWLSMGDVDWLVHNLYAEHKLKGVQLVAPDDPGPGGAFGHPEPATLEPTPAEAQLLM